MKKNLIALTLALLIALPVLGLAADVTAPVTPEAQAVQTAPETTAPRTGFVDADKDGICDNCGAEQGKNTEAPNYIDENKDGVCDHFGTDAQGQGQGRMQAMRGRMQQMMGRMQQMQGRMQNARGRGQGMMGPNQQIQGQGTQGNAQCPNYADANNDGVCDNFSNDLQRNFGPGRNRR